METKNRWIALVLNKNQECKNYNVNKVLGEFKDKVKFYYKNKIRKKLKKILLKITIHVLCLF